MLEVVNLLAQYYYWLYQK